MELELDEGRVFGARYYTVEPKFSFTPGWYNQHWNDMENWCRATFNESKGAFEPNQRWYVNNAKFWFRNEGDMMLFVLRWS